MNRIVSESERVELISNYTMIVTYEKCHKALDSLYFYRLDKYNTLFDIPSLQNMKTKPKKSSKSILQLVCLL